MKKTDLVKPQILALSAESANLINDLTWRKVRWPPFLRVAVVRSIGRSVREDLRGLRRSELQ